MSPCQNPGGSDPANQDIMYPSQTSGLASHSNEQTPGADSAITNSQCHPHWTDQTSNFQETHSRIADQRGLMDYMCYDHNFEQGLDEESVSSMNWLSPSNEVYETWNAQFTSFIEPIEFEASTFSLAIENATQCQQPLAPWDSEMAIQMSADPLEVSLDNTSNSESFNSPDGQAAITPRVSVEVFVGSKVTSRYYVDNKGARASVQQLRKKREMISRRPSSSNSLSQAVIRSAMPAISPAYLTGLEGQMTLSSFWVSVDLYNELLQQIRIPIGTEHSTISMASFPPLEHLNICCQLYFDNFHPGFPLIRKQSFSMEKDAWLLALAVAAMGVCYSYTEVPETASFRCVLHSTLRTTLESVLNDTTRDGGYIHATTPYKTPSSGDRVVIIQSRILNILLMAHSGEVALMSTACSEFAALVAVCNRMQLLSAIDKNDLIRGQSNEQLWERRWVQIQLRIRAGYMIWVSISHTIICR